MESFCLERGSIAITLVCNLKCARCSGNMPYRKNARHTPLADIQEYLRRYFKIVDYVKKFTITGGEPLLHPELPAVIRTVSQYIGQIGVVEIVTNGTIVPGKELISAVKALKDSVFFLVDNYGEEISVKIPEIDQVLADANVRHVIRNNNRDIAHCGGWVDYGNLTERKVNTQEETEQLFAKCAQSQKLMFCFTIVDGTMHPCGSNRQCMEWGAILEDYSLYVDLMDDSLTPEQQRQKLIRFYDIKSLPGCAYCNGLCPDSLRYVPGVQLTEEELECVKKGARNYHEVQAILATQKMKNDGG